LITNYPNPFTQQTQITFSTLGGHHLIQIFDTMGRLTRVLADGERPAGTYTITFDGSGLPNGVYYARLQNGSTQQIRTMLKVR
jgi:hypothetical protein